MKRVGLLVALLAGLLLAGVGTAGPGTRRTPRWSPPIPGRAPGWRASPDEVTLEFSEGVSLGAGYARVVTADGERVDTGTAAVDGNVVTIPLRGDLPDDGYLVTYRVVSADSHPISGAFSFVVGDGELVVGRVPRQVTAAVDHASPPCCRASRWIGFGGMALAIGIPVLALACWPGGWASTRLRRLAAAGTAAVAVSAVGRHSCCRARTPPGPGLGHGRSTRRCSARR